ncbi:hypothetical protein Bsp3421_002099 [Burkholderia sp. FERM BP-3421]|jgi:hypothetical protein|uniref:hypothetical protein n=1 Tax=Burkholderia sp. FERM BP-3421 TaxID=1494466 RepID=UPI00236257D6|nr:hypothetical protein [Burkholderia sp. FERM BP-3421]WDD92115.1 hypothetical protein Bsp3421_002099 [Burkholderia sp. FERM BP-3421]
MPSLLSLTPRGTRWYAAALVCAALAACGGDDDTAPPGKPNGDASPQQPTAPGETPASTPNLRCAP